MPILSDFPAPLTARRTHRGSLFFFLDQAAHYRRRYGTKCAADVLRCLRVARLSQKWSQLLR